MNHIAITSIAPGHKNFETQQKAIQSWIDFGLTVVSLNHPDEIEKLQKQFKNVEFVPTIRTNELLFSKPYPTVSAIIDHLKTRSESVFYIINSDIIIFDSWDLKDSINKKAEKGLVIIERFDYEDKYGTDFNNFKTATRNEGGFDCFVIHKKFLHIFPQTVLCLGQCFWDYWVPYQGILHKVPIYRAGSASEAFIFHKKHDVQYSDTNHQTTANIFRSEVAAIDSSIKSNMTRATLSQHVYYKIIENLKA